jgi:hypothetical protein
MGFGLDKLKASAAESAALGDKMVSRLEKEEGAEGVEQTVSTNRPTRFSPSPSTSAPAVGQESASSPSVAKSFQRPSFGGVAEPRKDTQEGASPSTGAKRPSFGGSSVPPSSGSAASEGASSGMPNLRGVFNKDNNQSRASFAKPSSQTPAEIAQKLPGDLTEQELFELVCTHRKMSASSIDSARAQAVKDPERVLRQMRHVYETEIAPNHLQTALNLQQAQEQNPDKVVFLVRKDGKEACRRLDLDKAKETGQILLQGATLESVQASATPFGPPSQLFAQEVEVVLQQEAQQEAPAPVQTAPISQHQRALKL